MNAKCNLPLTPSLRPFVRFYIWISNIEKDKRNKQKPQSCYVQRTPIFHWNTNVIRHDTCSIHHRITYLVDGPTFDYIPNNQVRTQYPFHIKFVCLCHSIHILYEPFWLLFGMGLCGLDPEFWVRRGYRWVMGMSGPLGALILLNQILIYVYSIDILFCSRAGPKNSETLKHLTEN